MHTVEDESSPVENNGKPQVSKNTNNSSRSTKGTPKALSNENEKKPKPYERKTTLDSILGLLASKSGNDLETMKKDVEKGETGEGGDSSQPPDSQKHSAPLAHSSQDSAWKFPAPKAEGSESESSPETSSIAQTVRARDINPDVSDSESDDNSEQVALVPFGKKHQSHEDT